MEDFVKRRTPVRAAFTKRYNLLITTLNETEINYEDIEIKLSSLERIASDLAELDEKISTALIDAKSVDFDSEYEKCEEYREKLDEARIRAKCCLNKIEKVCEVSASMVGEKTKLKLPKIELMKFNGEVKNWLTFWSQYSRIHDDSSIGDEDKFQYLLQCVVIGSRAREIVDSYPPTADNYSKVIDSLKTRFGREELLVEYYVRELLSLVVKNVVNSKIKMSILQLYDKLESHLRSLESIGVTSDKYAAMLFPLVESCIPEELLRVWLRNPVIIKEEKDSYGDKLSHLLLFLRAEVEGEERISLAKAGFKSNEIFTRKPNCKDPETLMPTATDLLSGVEVGKSPCIFCRKAHNSQDCFKGQKMSYEEKMDILKKNKACFSCMKTGHRSSNCKTNVKCIVCGRRHYTIVCPGLSKLGENPQISSVEKRGNTSLFVQSRPEVLLQTLMVSIEANKKRKIVRALFDTGSQRSYVLTSTMDQMGATAQRTEHLTHVVFGGLSSRRKHQCYKLSISNLTKGYSCDLQVLDQSVICGHIPSVEKGPWLLEIQGKGIDITDVGKSSLQIELLIGADYIGQLYTGNVIHISGGLVAMETLLGWVVMGRSEVTENKIFSTILATQSNNVADLWKLETIGIMDPCEADTQKEFERAALDHFSKTAVIDPDGRYEVKLPWMRNVEELPSNRDTAGRRLVSTSKKLFSQNRFQSYAEVFVEWKNAGFIEDSTEGPGHYLPHRGVFKFNSSTQVRPVFDASCKSRGNLSLNDCLMKGPNLLELIPTVLLKFRLNEIGVISDIKRAFLQISVAEEDRKYLKFLWWKGKNRTETKVFQHARVVFGLNCSPFLLVAVIHHHLYKYVGTPVQDVAIKLKESFYVDNCVTSVKSEQELLEFIKISTELMAKAKFELRGWEFSGEKNLSAEHRLSSVLGLSWDKFEDVLFCDVSTLEVPTERITRRIILSMTNRIFDPIGFTCPATLCPKLLLQESWQNKLSWDSEVSEGMKKKFLNWVKDAKMLNHIKIPRRVCASESSLSLHVFSDASGHSYASVAFLRGQVGSKVTAQLVMAKSRIAPLKQITIPRLELLACVIGARLAEFVKRSLNLKDVTTCFWTDSTTALHWIKRDEAWSVFVRNRVKEIRRLSSIQDWNHVPGDLNPADLPSRGCSVSRLLSSRWWEGPPWLLLSENEWPKTDPLSDEKSVFQEKLKVSVILVSNPSEQSRMFSYFSSYTKTIRMVAWILRFFKNVSDLKDDHRKGNLSVLEVCEAEDRIIKIMQDETLTTELVKILKTLNVFKDAKGLYRIKSKLTERKDTEDFRYPVLLPGKHRLVELLIQECHAKNSHAGVQIVLSKLREKFWILNGRRSVRRQINKCLKCKRYNAKNVETMPIGLPEDRIKNASVFEVVGVDLAGPLYLKGGEKCWIVLFTCAVYRAIHLELVLSLSTKSFLLCLRRFIARRGRPKVIYSDNGTNFVGAENLLQSLDWKAIEEETSL